MKNAFVRDPNSYQRDLEIIDGAHHDYARYLQLHTNRPWDECLTYAKEKLTPGEGSDCSDPKALILVKDKNEDRHPAKASFLKFLHRVKKQNLLLSPSMAAYQQATVEASTHALYIEEGVNERKIVKGEMMDAEREGNVELAKIKNGDQQNLKTNSNSYSGATVSPATILYYKSTHSSLTSTCRTATSYANATNEKFIAGNRHYYNPEITKANMVSIINNVDLALIEECCDTYGLVYPTAEQAHDCIKRSTEPYWESDTHHQLIHTMLFNMRPVERAAIVYAADLYHLHKYNPDFVVNFLLDFSQVADEKEYAFSDEEFKAVDGDVELLANFTCFDMIKARKEEVLKKEDPVVWEKIKATANRTLVKVNDYSLLINALWLVNTVPSSIYAFPSVYRRAAAVSDTDSTMVTMQYWVEVVFGYISFHPDAKRLVFFLVFIITEMLTHILAIQSANMGVPATKIHLLSMKNEFYFAVLALMNRSKHYYASQDAKEGVMFLEARLEVKGVGLRDSKVPKHVNDEAKGLMKNTIEIIKSEEKLTVRDILTHIANIERSIIESVNVGSYEYMTTGQVKSPDSYKGGEDSPAYVQYLLWRDVFGPFLGETAPPAYTVVKVSLKAGNRTEINQWCEAMNNPALAEKFKTWMAQRQRSDLTTLMIPMSVVETNGIPKEIIAGIDIRKMILNTMGTFYLMLEANGIFMQDKRISRLVSDYH